MDNRVVFHDDFGKLSAVRIWALRLVENPWLRWTRGRVLQWVVLAGLLAGCTSKDLPGVEEYKQITTKALAALHSSLQSLDQVSAGAVPCPPSTVAAFSREVQRLEVDSIKVRARSQAILARGDAYFGDWSESIARIKNPQIRELAAKSRPELEQSFGRIKSASQQAGAAFKPYLAGLRELRVKLENDPGGIGADPVKNLIRTTRESGQQVVRELESIESELQSVTTMLTPGRSAAKH